MGLNGVYTGVPACSNVTGDFLGGSMAAAAMDVGPGSHTGSGRFEEPRRDTRDESREPAVDPTGWPMLGRQDALQRAAHVIGGEAPDGGLVLMGPMGSGHSRLLQAIGIDATAAGFRVMAVEVPKVTSKVPFGPLFPLVAEAGSGLGAGGPVHTSLWNAVSGDPEGRGSVVLVDGLDFLDDASIAFLQQVARHEGCHVVGTCRAAACTCAHMTSTGFAVEAIPRLTDDEIAALLRLTLDDHVAPATLDGFVMRSKGLPRLAASLVMGTVTSGGLQRSRGGWHLVGTIAASRTDILAADAVMSHVRSETAALVHVVSSLGAAPVGLVRRSHERELVEAELRGILEANRDGVAVAHPFDAIGIGGERGPIGRVAKALEHDLRRCGLDSREALSLAALLRTIADDLSDPLVSLIGARAALVRDEPGEARRIADAVAQVAPKASEAMLAVVAVHEGADAYDAADVVLRAMDSACDDAVDRVAQAALAYLDTGLGVPPGWLEHTWDSRYRGTRAELSLQWERFDDARSGFKAEPGVPSDDAAAALAVRAHLAAAGGHVGDVCECVQSAHRLTDPARGQAVLPSPTAAIRLGMAAGLSDFLMGATTPPPPGTWWWSSLVDRATDAVAALLRGHPEDATAHLRALDSTLHRPGTIVGGIRACCDAHSGISPELSPDSRPSGWWEARAGYIALAVQGDMAAACGAARELADRLEPVPTHLLVTLHDLVRLDDCDGCHRLVHLVESCTELGRLPVARAMSAHARGLIAGDPAAIAAAGQEFERLDAANLALEAGRQADPRSASLRPFVSAVTGLGAAPRWSRLTPRESEVAGLASEGMTNRAIAAHLGISCRTVENQLSRAYAKLGISSRTDLAGILAEATLGLPAGR